MDCFWDCEQGKIQGQEDNYGEKKERRNGEKIQRNCSKNEGKKLQKFSINCMLKRSKHIFFKNQKQLLNIKFKKVGTKNWRNSSKSWMILKNKKTFKKLKHVQNFSKKLHEDVKNWPKSSKIVKMGKTLDFGETRGV